MSAETFPGSRIRHGTHSGWTRHIRDGERPCDPCYAAKAQYDRRRRSAPEVIRASRLRARAQHRAYQALAHKYPDEYAALYRQFCDEFLGGAA